MKCAQLKQRAVQSIKTNFKDKSFLMKFFAMIFNMLMLIFWRAPNSGSTGLLGPSQECLFGHTVPAYMVILASLVFVYLLEEKPDKWFLRIFLFTGSVLFGVTGVINLYNCFKPHSSLGWFPVIIGFLSLTNSLLLLMDLLIDEEIILSNHPTD